jgi:hypothetical protein
VLVEDVEEVSVVDAMDVSVVVEGNELDDKLLEDEDVLVVEVTEDEAGCVEPEVLLAEDDDSEIVNGPPVVVLFPEPGFDAR